MGTVAMQGGKVILMDGKVLLGDDDCCCCCDTDCCVTIVGRSLCGPGEDSGEEWVLVSGSGKASEPGEGYYTLDTGTEVYRFDLRWWPEGTCGKIKFVAKSRIDEGGGAFRELEWGTYDLNPEDEGFVYGGSSVGKCPTAIEADEEPTVDESSPGPTLPPLGLETYGYSCDCTLMRVCWLFEFDLEFLGRVFWETGGALGTQWIPYTGNQVLWVDPTDPPDASKFRRTCADGVAVDEANPGPPGWAFGPTDPFLWAAAGNVEADSCEFAMALQSDFATDPGGWYPLTLSAEGVSTLALTEDLTGETPAGAVDEITVRGTITVTRIVGTAKGDCDCNPLP